VPEGVAREAVAAFLGAEAHAGAVATRGALTVRVLPFVPQPDYDRLLWACDLNFVRGEDSWVRAQWAGRPFVWHIYPQDENLHHKKLRAFLQKLAFPTSRACIASCCAGTARRPKLRTGRAVDGIAGGHAGIAARSADWQAQMLANGDLASNLLAFAASLR
jgi:uncharacterized repeat protein (TIGR03837 family)